MTVNALSMLDQVLAGYDYKHYFAREVYYTGTQNGPHVIVYLSDSDAIQVGSNSISLGSGVRVDCYTSMGTNVGAQRLSVSNYGGGNITWGAQDLVSSDSRPMMIGGVRYALPASQIRQNNQANMAGAAASFSGVLLGFFVCLALFWGLFRRR